MRGGTIILMNYFFPASVIGTLTVEIKRYKSVTSSEIGTNHDVLKVLGLDDTIDKRVNSFGCTAICQNIDNCTMAIHATESHTCHLSLGIHFDSGSQSSVPSPFRLTEQRSNDLCLGLLGDIEPARVQTAADAAACDTLCDADLKCIESVWKDQTCILSSYCFAHDCLDCDIGYPVTKLEAMYNEVPRTTWTVEATQSFEHPTFPSLNPNFVKENAIDGVSGIPTSAFVGEPGHVHPWLMVNFGSVISGIRFVKVLKKTDSAASQPVILERFNYVEARIGNVDVTGHSDEDPIIVNDFCNIIRKPDSKLIGIFLCHNVLSGRFLSIQKNGNYFGNTVNQLDLDEIYVYVE